MSNTLSHLAFFLPSLSGGGAERVMLDVAREAAKHVARVDLVLVKHSGAYAQEDPGQVNIIDLHASRSLVSVPRLAGYLRRERPQAIISAMPHANITVLVAARLIRNPAQVIISEHSMMSRHKNAGPKIKMMLRAARLLYPRSDRAIACSKQALNTMVQFTGLPSARAKVIHNPIDLERIHDLRDRAPRHAWLSDKVTPVIVTAGRLVVEKDQETLVRALAAMNRTESRLVIFGEGPLRAQLEALRDDLGLQNRVDMPGFVANPYAEIARADVLALPSKSEGFANVVIEALACNTPVVATCGTGGIADSLDDGRTVRLVNIGDEIAMASALDTCIASPLTDGAMQAIAGRFSLTRGWKEYRDVVLAALADAGR
jgi:glycosyltransferase involved in cell wall biosynthesis